MSVKPELLVYDYSCPFVSPLDKLNVIHWLCVQVVPLNAHRHWRGLVSRF